SALDPRSLAWLGVDLVEVDEPVGANVLALGQGLVLVALEAPGVARTLADRGLRVVTVPGSELQRADGRLTCLSLRLPALGQWCA
ncbi:MAG: hypothetical protein GXP62_11825, partial [Oligoflexia bacterium]|nr:hypothetical protein [Oligoflexia bacterium]